MPGLWQHCGVVAARRAVVIEDDADLRLLLESVLAQAGLEVTSSENGVDGIALVGSCAPDLVTLDLNLPDMDGIEVCRQVRGMTDAYLIMVTARADEIDRLQGLEVGADDYVTKPFSPRELRARVAAMFRRPRTAPMPVVAPDDSGAEPGTGGDRVGSTAGAAPAPSDRVLAWGRLEIDLDGHEVRCDGEPVTLTLTEFRILAALAEHPGRVWSREALLRAVWDTDWTDNTHLVDVHVGNLRRKLGEGAAAGSMVKTVRGVGYRMAPA